MLLRFNLLFYDLFLFFLALLYPVKLNDRKNFNNIIFRSFDNNRLYPVTLFYLLEKLLNFSSTFYEGFSMELFYRF